jgi:hypothetical protein
VAATGFLTPPANALDTPNALMTIDGMTMLHAGLFRNGTPNDGYNTFQFGPIQFAAGTLGRYKSFYFVKNATGDGGISHNARYHSDTPETWNGTAYAPVTGLDLDSDYFSIVDRASFGQIFDPAEYQIEAKFKPNIGVAGLPSNTAPLFTVGLDQNDGFVWDAEASVYKRANDAFTYNIGAANNPINDWYAAAPKDADGFATWTVPVTSPSFIQRGFYFAFGDGTFRTDNVVTGNGRMFDAGTSTWSDANDGLDTTSFGGGATDLSRPGSQLKAPNGVPLISFGAPSAETGLSLQVKSISLKRINPGSIVARIDANTGLTFKFGSGFGRSNAASPIVVDGINFLPSATDQISRFDQNGMTNLIFNMRTPDNANEVHRFFIRGGPGAQQFDGTSATVNVRAKLLEPLTNPGIAQSLTLVAKDLDGNDNGAGTGADEYTYSLALNQFNTSTFTTVSVPLSAFTLSTFVPTVPGGAAGSGPFGFANAGDGQRTNFDLYEFGGLVPAGGLLRLELEYMDIRVQPPGVPGDYNGNGVVDGADYVLWRNGGPLQNEVDTPGTVNAADYTAWRARFGNTSGSGSGVGGAAVPEPATWLVTSMIAAIIGLGRRRINKTN